MKGRRQIVGPEEAQGQTRLDREDMRERQVASWLFLLGIWCRAAGFCPGWMAGRKCLTEEMACGVVGWDQSSCAKWGQCLASLLERRSDLLLKVANEKQSGDGAWGQECLCPARGQVRGRLPGVGEGPLPEGRPCSLQVILHFLFVLKTSS